MRLFDNYYNGISDILNKGNTRSFSFSGEENVPSYFEKGTVNESIAVQASANVNNKVLIEFDKNQLTNLFGENKSSFASNTIGSHPDFLNIKHNEYERHYCVSMFMDIKGSTRLNEKYTLLEIRKIKDTILTLAIHVAGHFGGHIHRLQGDGIFIQFVRKGLSEQDAVINALNTAAILTHFISNDLAQVFEDNGVKPLSVRTGIDLGFKDDVIWSHYGIPGCSELTTTSLHTDLAAKLQSQAKSNGICVGGNIRDVLDFDLQFCKNLFDGNGAVDYYIYKGVKNYRKFEFNWVGYLNSFDFTKLNSSGNGVEIIEPRFTLRCIVTKSGTFDSYLYYQNSGAIPKESDIEYTLLENGNDYFKKDFDSISWNAHNFGKEAKVAGQEKHDFGGRYKNSIHCSTSAAYTGHHYVECIITRPNSNNLKIKFPIFVGEKNS